ncbi:molybdenum cofactor guanylyltransferase MobA [Enterobacteriaceae bacterium LUAb1]
MMKRDEINEITGVILAGGRGTRMGGQDKGLVKFQNQALYLHVLTRLEPQVGTILINANRHIAAYQQSGFPVIKDNELNYSGPLAGILAALQTRKTPWYLFTACDIPYLPNDMARTLWHAKGNSFVVWAYSAGRDHPTQALVHQSLAPKLAAYLQYGERKVLKFFQQSGGHAVSFSSQTAFDNMNTFDDLKKQP